MIFSFLSGTTYLHRMDIRKRFMGFLFIQICIFQDPVQLIHIMLFLFFMYLSLHIPKLLRRLGHCLIVFSPLFFLMIFSAFLTPSPHALYVRIFQLAFSLLTTEILLITSSPVDFTTLARWLAEKIPRLHLLFETVIFCFLFLSQIFSLYNSLNMAFQLRGCRIKSHPLRYMHTLPMVLIRELFTYLIKIEQILTLRGYTSTFKIREFKKARGDTITLIAVACIGGSSLWLSKLF